MILETVYYVRQWSDRIPSMWRQSIMMGKRADFFEFYAVIMRNAVNSGAINYSVVWNKFAKYLDANH